MVKRSKNFNKAKEMVEKDEYSLEEAVSLIKKMSFVKFDESLDISLNLGIDPKHSDQMVRGTIVLPHGTGKTKRVCVIASGEKVTEAEKTGADFAGSEELIEKIQQVLGENPAIEEVPESTVEANIHDALEWHNYIASDNYHKKHIQIGVVVQIKNSLCFCICCTNDSELFFVQVQQLYSYVHRARTNAQHLHYLKHNQYCFLPGRMSS